MSTPETAKNCRPVRECGILFSNDLGGIPEDETGCQLPCGHEGPHEFTAVGGSVWLWETDWDCDCEHCQECEGDYCAIYWLKK